MAAFISDWMAQHTFIWALSAVSVYDFSFHSIIMLCDVFINGAQSVLLNDML